MARRSAAALAAEAAEAEAAAQAAALAACKQFMRVDGTDDDSLITALMAAAKTYLDKAGIPEPAEEDPQYTLAVQILTLHYYDHRDSVGDEAAIPTGLQPIINQMKHCGEAPL